MSVHPDDEAVDLFAAAMKKKLAEARAKGRGGWDGSEDLQQRLSDMLRDHVAKGDPRDVANFACFLWNRGEGIAPVATPQARPDGGERATHRCEICAYEGTPDPGVGCPRCKWDEMQTIDHPAPAPDVARPTLSPMVQEWLAMDTEVPAPQARPEFSQRAFGLSCTVAWTELAQALRADGHDVKDSSGPTVRKWIEGIVRDTFNSTPQARPDGGEACCHSWHDYGQVNQSWCSKCEARAVAGYEDRPFTGTHPAPAPDVALINALRGLRADADEARVVYAGHHASGTFRRMVQKLDAVLAAAQQKEATNGQE